jgi:nitrate reductase gamma subunit
MIYIDQFPIFIAIGVSAMLLVLAMVWLSHTRKGNSDEQPHDYFTDWVLLGLLLIAVFVLGAFIMYVFLI